VDLAGEGVGGDGEVDPEPGPVADGGEVAGEEQVAEVEATGPQRHQVGDQAGVLLGGPAEAALDRLGDLVDRTRQDDRRLARPVVRATEAPVGPGARRQEHSHRDLFPTPEHGVTTLPVADGSAEGMW
jgi:hypothetical protein